MLGPAWHLGYADTAGLQDVYEHHEAEHIDSERGNT